MKTSTTPNRNLANAAFFGMKKLETRLTKLENEIEAIKKQIREEDLPTSAEAGNNVQV